MRDLARRHGPLMLLRLSEGSYGILFAPYGEEWRQLRRRALQLAPGPVVPSRARGGGPPARPLRRGVRADPASGEPEQGGLSIRVRRVSGGHHRQQVQGPGDVPAAAGPQAQDRARAELAADLFPSSRLAMMLSSMPRTMRHEHDSMMAFIDTIIQQHQADKSVAGDDEDLLDVLLRIQRDDTLDPPLTTDNIKAVIIRNDGDHDPVDHGGADEEPESDAKAQDEVRRVLHGQKTITEENLGDLHYLNLIIKEELRLHTPVPMLMPRECGNPCQVLGFDVPVGAMVLVNAWAIGRDPAYWDAPEEFMPERFETCNVDFKGADFQFIPFGAGRRMCPGIGFGLANVELPLASLLYHFDWALPDGMEPGELDMTEALGVTTRRRSDLLLVPTVRAPFTME
ncbi:hypothetical protein QOZ80_2AG0125250 [Eleusine coracana subsp. coracana]|nr:hypothetical protein QOZ80_2AG0125250 [Eleusine coracana subsp. coracana]